MPVNASRAGIWYGGQSIAVPVETAENILDAIYGIDQLGGRHVYSIGGGDGDPRIYIWIAPGVPISVNFPPGYTADQDRPNYVDMHLEREARFRLGIPVTEGESSS